MNITTRYRKRKQSMPAILFIVVLAGFWGCDGDDRGGAPTTRFGEVICRLEIESSQTTFRSGRSRSDRFDCEGNHIRTVEIEVHDEGGDLIALGGPWNCENRGGYVEKVEAGTNRMVVALARDDSERIIFRGWKDGIEITANETTDVGTIQLYKVLNRAPEFDPVADQVISGETPLEIVISATDPDAGDQLAYGVENLPEGAMFDPASQVFFWLPHEVTEGLYSVLFTVSDDDPFNPLSDFMEVGIRVVVGPYVMSTEPADLAAAVCPTRMANAVFSEPMDLETIDDNAFTLTGVQNGNRFVVTGDLRYEDEFLSFVPDEDLLPATQYEASISGDVLSAEGEPLSDGYGHSWSFTTAAIPGVVSMSPDRGSECVELMPSVQVSFSQPMDSSTIDENVFTLSYGVEGQILIPVEGEVRYDDETQTATFTPREDLSTFIRYEADISGEASDLCEMPLNGGEGISWSFTTITPAPSVIDRFPVGEIVTDDSGYREPVYVTFSHPMDPEAFDQNTFKVTTGSSFTVPGTITFQDGNSRVLFTPDANWAATGSEYTVSISNTVTDQCGRPLGTDGGSYEWSFTIVYRIF